MNVRERKKNRKKEKGKERQKERPRTKVQCTVISLQRNLIHLKNKQIHLRTKVGCCLQDDKSPHSDSVTMHVTYASHQHK